MTGTELRHAPRAPKSTPSAFQPAKGHLFFDFRAETANGQDNWSFESYSNQTYLAPAPHSFLVFRIIFNVFPDGFGRKGHVLRQSDLREL